MGVTVNNSARKNETLARMASSVRLSGSGAVTLATGNYVNVKKSNGLDTV